MNNLKRVLSTVLAGTMLAGMMVVGASAATFTDQEDIEHTEAVDTMVTLGVINGKDDGSYDPDAIVTRAEMAKMITLMLNGGKEPVLTVKSNPTYSDIDGHWAEKYIEYCSGDNSTKSQIIAGQGDGTFGPDAPVTGSAAAKMALVALGYDASVFHFTGVDWEINVNGIANSPDADLYDGLEGIDPSNGMTRDEAAQLLYNALDALVMNKTYDKVLSNGEISYTYSLSEKTMMESKFGAVKIEGIVVANEYADLSNSDADLSDGLIGKALSEGETKFKITNAEDQKKFDGTQTFSVASGEDELGRKVSFYVKPSSTAKKSTVLGSLMVSGENTVVVDYSKSTTASVLDDNDLDLDKDAVYYSNYAHELKAAGAKDNYVPAGAERILIDNDDDGDVEIIFYNQTYLAKVTKYSTKDDGSISLEVGGKTVTLKADDVIGFDDVAKGDYVLYTTAGGKAYVEVAETVEGQLEAYKTSTYGANKAKIISSLTIDGTAYSVSMQAVSSDLTQAAHLGEDFKPTLDTDVVAYLDAQGKIIATGDVDDTTKNYGYVKGIAMSNNDIDDDRIKVLDADGTTKTYTLDSDTPDSVSKWLAKGQVISYTINSDGELKATDIVIRVSDQENVETDAFTKGKTAITTDNTTYATSSTVFFYVDGNKVSVYTGYASAPSVDSGKGAVYAAGTKALAVVFSGTGSISESVSDHLFLDSYGSIYADYTKANVVLPGTDEIVTVEVDNDAKPTAGSIYKYEINSDGYYELTAIDSLIKDATVTNTTSSTIAVKADSKVTEYDITDDTVVVDVTDDTIAYVGETVAAEDDTVTLLVDNGEVLMMVITKNG